MQAEKRIHGALILNCSSYISKIVWWLPMFNFGIFCHLLRLIGIYQVGPRLGIWKVSFSLFFSPFYFSFSFFLFLSFLFLFYSSFFLSLSRGAPFSSGAPGHCPPMPLSRYATDKSLVVLWIVSTVNESIHLKIIYQNPFYVPIFP